MTNPFSGIISDTLKDTFNNAIDALLASDGLTRKCTILYVTASYTECPNCYVNAANGKSNGVYKPGGPIPFTKGICPHCNGVGRISAVSSDTVYLGILTDPKKFLKTTFQSPAIPTGTIQTVSIVSETYQKLKNAEFLYIDIDNADYRTKKYTLAGVPEFIGLGDNRYCVAYWGLSGG